MEVYDKEGNTKCDPESVLNIWASEFKTLFSKTDNDQDIDTNEYRIRERCLDDSLYLNELRMSDPLLSKLIY